MVAEGVYVALAAGLAVAIPGIFSALGVGMTGVAASAVAAEDPKKAYKALFFVIMPGTQGIYGFVAAFLTVLATGLSLSAAGIQLKSSLAGIPNIGLLVFMCALPAVLQGITSYFQGKVASAAVSAFAKLPAVFAPGAMYVVAVELYAILGLLSSILMLSLTGIL